MKYLKIYENFKNDYLLDIEFESIFKILENATENPITFEWDLTNNDKNTYKKVKEFFNKLPSDKVVKYFIKFLDKLKFIPEVLRKKTMVKYASIFLALAPLSTFLINNNNNEKTTKNKIVKEFIEVTKKSNFEVAQKIVSAVEGDYSNDKDDTGNWIEFELNGKKVKRFIGSKYGVSAEVLKKYLGRVPKKEDMINLSYNTALDIYKNNFWDKNNLNNFSNQSIANILYDCAINQGIGGVKNVLRKSLRENGINISDDDNPFNSDIIKQVNCINQEKLFNSIKKFRELRYRQARTFDKHGEGWLNRISKIKFM